jgi:hypothetical protein
MKARIFQPAKTAMQSGRARTRRWHLEFEPELARHTDALMGWCGSADMRGQIVMGFDTKDQAIAFAERHAIPYDVREPRARKRRIRAYADNFAFARVK